MELKLYNTVSSNNTINKVLTDEVTFDIKFKDVANIQSPVIKINSKNLITSNYAFIPDFNRYYFIEQIIIESNNINSLYMKCDLLETYKEDILNSVGLIEVSKDGDDYLDIGYDNEIKKDVLIYESDKELMIGSNILMVTLGGGD